MDYSYITDGSAIYDESFRIIREESDLSRLPDDLAPVAVRMIHASAQTDIVKDLAWSDQVVQAAREALLAGAPILCDSTMVATGIIRSRLPRDNQVICLLQRPEVAERAREKGITKTMAAVELWAELPLSGEVTAGVSPDPLADNQVGSSLADRPDPSTPASGTEETSASVGTQGIAEAHDTRRSCMLDGAIVAIGNAPTSLFRLLEIVRDTGIRPAAVIGIPVGFVGAAESKQALAENDLGLEFLALLGRRGGSAITVSALNAIASTDEHTNQAILDQVRRVD